MTKSTKLIIIVIAALTIIVAIFAFLNRESVLDRKEAQDSGTFSLCAGEEKYTVTLDKVMSLSPFDIKANYKTSGQALQTKVYQGVSLKSLVESLKIDYSGYESVSFTAADGYASALSLSEAMDDGNCYIVVSMDGEPLGTKESGGSGPFMMILARDQFSQRWCKFLLEVKMN